MTTGASRLTRQGAALHVLVFTAAIGGGHEALAEAIRAELERSGHQVTIRDGLRDLSSLLAWITQ